MSNDRNKVYRADVDDVLNWEEKNVHRPHKELTKQIRTLNRTLVTPVPPEGEASGPSALCLSGGGIRSAAISLGFLQACDRSALLTKFDYLLTVSGGGYIGGWLTALIHRLGGSNVKPTIGIDDDHGAIGPKELGAEALDNLRRYSNYLTPRLGLFSGDSLSLVAIYLRNLILNGLILLSVLGTATVLPKIIYRLFKSGSFKWMWGDSIMLKGSAFLAVVSGVYTVYAATGPKAAKARAAAPPGRSPFQDLLSTDSFVLWKVSLLLLSLLMLSGYAYWTVQRNPEDVACLGWIGLKCGCVCALGLLFWGLILRSLGQPNIQTQWVKIICNVVQVLGAYAIGATALIQIVTFPPSPLLYIICVPPALLLIYLLGVALFAGFVNPILSDDDREWWARAGGYLFFAAALWVIVAMVSLCEELFPPLWKWLFQDLGTGIPGVNWASVSTVVSGILALLTRESNVVGTGQSMGTLNKIGSFVFAIVCPVFIAALLLSLSLGEGLIAQHIDKFGLTLVLMGIRVGYGGLFCVVLLIALTLTALAMGCVVDVNKFSLHNTYRNRLIRTFLGASHRDRKPHPFTGFDEKDNVYLHEIDPKQRPHHIVCAAVNLYAGENLAWQERHAALFTFSPGFCGSDFLHYRQTHDYGGPKGITLGTAIAISGAAANPNMGFYTSPDRAFVMTLLNVRLGWWLGNPNFPKQWRREGPFPALRPLLSELLLLTRESSSFVNVSDGGHFDDTAVYEAVRRRCSMIFLVDANATHENVARMIRKVRIDFGVDITLRYDLSKEGIPGHLYVIQYPESARDRTKHSGVLVRVFPALDPFKDSLPADVINFSKGDPDFPSDRLENQWYGEARFESYRKLGWEIGTRLFANEKIKPLVEALKQMQ